jgi:long-chain fatty acid transport protein
MRKTQLLLALAAIGFAGSALATNGMFSHGYGMKAKGMGGASTAMSEDTYGGANNPASMVWTGNRIDFGADLFSPRRAANRTGSLGGAIDGSANSDSEYFVIPEFGYNRLIQPGLSLGVTVYGNGGMNSNYPTGQLDAGICAGLAPTGVPANMLCGNGRLGVDLMQLVIAPTVAYKINEQNSIGLSPLLGYQRFRAEGLQAFTLASSDGANLTNRGYDSSTGYGVRVGWMGKISDKVTLGAAYSTKMDMGKLDKYKGLFAEQGNFDVPENYNLGISIKATPQTTVALDYQRINYSGVKSIGNSSLNILGGAALGAANGSGFGWKDINVWKLGVEYAASKEWTWRAGYNHGDNPIKSEDVTFNILAPGVIQDHLTLGFTYTTTSGSELTMSYMHGFENSVSGVSLLGTLSGAGGTDKIKMHQDAIGVAYSWKM